MSADQVPSRWSWRRRRIWVVASASALLAAVAALALVTQTSGAACAATVPGVARVPALASTSGQATFYAATGAGNCSFDPVSDPLVVALGDAEYRSAAACGEYLDVTGPDGTVRVKVTDRCPECAAGHLDLSRQAFARIGNPTDGVIRVTYRLVVNPPVPAMTVRVKEGSSRYWLALRIDNHGNPLTGVELRSGSGWQSLPRADYNYWIDQNGAGPGPFTLRVTDATGRRSTLRAVTLTPQAVQRPALTVAGGGATHAASTPAHRTAVPSPAPPSRAPDSVAPSSTAPWPDAASTGAAQATRCR